MKVAVVGVGHMGRHHARILAGLPPDDDVQLVGVVGLAPDMVAEAAKATGARPYTDYRELLGRVDAVSIAVPATLHYEVGSAFLAAGADLFMEKPLAVTLEEASRLMEAADSAGRVLQVGHLERFNAAVAAVRPLVKGPLALTACRLSPFVDRGTDVDVVLDLMIHDLDLLQTLAVGPVEQVQAIGRSVRTTHLDMVTARLRCADGSMADLTASRVSSVRLRQMTVIQPGACFAVDHQQQSATQWLRDEATGHWRHGPLWVEHTDPLKAELSAFIQSVKTRRRPPVGGQEGCAALALALKVTEAVRTGGAWASRSRRSERVQ